MKRPRRPPRQLELAVRLQASLRGQTLAADFPQRSNNTGMLALSAAGNAAALSTRCWQNTGHRAGAALNAGRSRLRGLAPRRLRASRRPLRGVYAIGFDLPGSPDVKGAAREDHVLGWHQGRGEPERAMLERLLTMLS